MIVCVATKLDCSECSRQFFLPIDDLEGMMKESVEVRCPDCDTKLWVSARIDEKWIEDNLEFFEVWVRKFNQLQEDAYMVGQAIIFDQARKDKPSDSKKKPPEDKE